MYVTHNFLGYLFNLHNSNICRMLKILEPMLAKVIHIKKDRTLTENQVMEILADVSEIPIQRPRKKQKDKYSGKKKDHTLKFEIGMSTNGEIIHISKVYDGKIHETYCTGIYSN